MKRCKRNSPTPFIKRSILTSDDHYSLEHLGMTTNFRCMRRKHNSDKQFSRCENMNTNARVKCSLTLTNDFAERWSSALFKVEQLQTLFESKNIWVEMLISFLKFSLHILNMNVFYVLLDVYSFGVFICFHLIGFTFTWGLYLDLSMGSTGVSFLSSLHRRRS